MNKKIKVIVDDVELEVLVSEEELAKLTEKKKKTGYERLPKDGKYYTVLCANEVDCVFEGCVRNDNRLYENANYYTDKTLAKNNARADKLMRQLRRFAAENCEEVQWNTESSPWFIYYNYNSICPEFWFNSKIHGVVYFDTKENAQKAIDAFKDELIWYFTEYRDRV